MMTIALLLGSMLISLLVALYFRNRSLYKQSQLAYDEICAAHKALNYPALEKDTQFKILISGDPSPIAALIPDHKEKGTPLSLLKHYITVNKEEFADHLLQSDFLDKKEIEAVNSTVQDGYWIVGQQVIDQERGNVRQAYDFRDRKEAATIFADLLWTHSQF